MILTKKQTNAIDYLEDSTTNEVLFGGGAGGAKSFLGVYWITKMALKYDGTRYVIGRWKRKYLYETTLNSLWEVFKLQGVKPDEHYKFNAQSGIIKFVNGSEILLKDLFTYPSDPNFDSLGSLEITAAFVDEANQVDSKAKDILRSRIRYKIDQYGLIPKILYSCNPAKNWVYTDFFKPHREKTLRPNRAFIQALAMDNPFISEHYIESLKDLPQASKERLLFGNWEYDSDPATLINYDNIIELWTNDYVGKDENGALEQNDHYITADIARFGTDKTVAMVWHGLRVIDMITLDVSSVKESVQMIEGLSMKYKVSMGDIIIDADGIGGGVKDYLRGSKGFNNGGKPIKEKNFANLKTQCYYKLADMINKGLIYIGLDDGKESIIQELEYVKSFDMDKDNKLKIMPKDKVKEHIGRSPDYSDCLMMRMFFELRPKSRYSI